MNYNNVYDYRFKSIDKNLKNKIWKEICIHIHKQLNKPDKVLDPAAGECEFINNITSQEKWAIDLNKDFLYKHADNNVKKVIGNNLYVEIPSDYFDGIFVSNFLEHLESQKEVNIFLERMYFALREDGLIAIMGPNFRYTYKSYFDFADHNVILTERAVAEHLVGAGFKIVKVYSKFLPFSFHSKLPKSKLLVKIYLKLPIIWRILGKQFLLIAKK